MHDVRKVFDVNTLGGIALVQRFIPLLRQHKVHQSWGYMYNTVMQAAFGAFLRRLPQ